MSTCGGRLGFAESADVLWSAPVKGEHLNHPGEGSLDAHPSKGKLKGSFHWPFMLTLPQTVDLPVKGGGFKTFRLPCSLGRRFIPVVINYRIIATMAHGTVFKPDHVYVIIIVIISSVNKLYHFTSRVSTNIHYTTKSQPGPPSVARQLAYQEHSPLVGPDGDPDGWHTLPVVTLKGTVFNTRPAEITYTVSNIVNLVIRS